MKTLVTKFALWLLKKTGYALFAAPVSDALLLEAAKATKIAEGMTGGDEYKRHQAYALLIDAFPNEPRRNLGIAIELAIQGNSHVAP